MTHELGNPRKLDSTQIRKSAREKILKILKIVVLDGDTIRLSRNICAA